MNLFISARRGICLLQSLTQDCFLYTLHIFPDWFSLYFKHKPINYTARCKFHNWLQIIQFSCSSLTILTAPVKRSCFI